MDDDMDMVLIHAPDAVAREIGDEIFVAMDATGAIHRLNATAAGVWRALSVPGRSTDVIALFAQAFPEQPIGRLTDEIGSVIDDLRARRLLIASAHQLPKSANSIVP